MLINLTFIPTGPPSYHRIGGFMNKFALAAATLVSVATVAPVAHADAATLSVDVSGANGYGPFGNPLNTVRNYNIGAGSRVTAISYSLNITAFAPSFLSEAFVAFSNTNRIDGASLNPGVADDAPGTASYTASASLVDLGLDFTVGDDGLLRLEYFDDFDDGDVAPDSAWNSGNIIFSYDAIAPTPGPITGAVPESATWAMMIMGFGLAGFALRNRRHGRVTTRVQIA